ncbi:MAG: hypothetical protein WCK47_08285 [bacterium]|nr:hypothetical protein [Candidatus Sumerlaeota bacterium]
MNKECWLEIDLCWFQGGQPQEKAAELFNRIEPLWKRNPTARHGLSLCAGWLLDIVLCWNGNLDDVIPTCMPPVYETWSYRRLAELITALKHEADRHGIQNFNVALMMIGVESMTMDPCEGFSGRTEEIKETARYYITSQWFRDHREVFDPRFDLFYFGATVITSSDEAACREPHPTLAVYFADKLCDLAAAIGLDAIVLRDAIFSPAYVRGNSRARYMEPAARRDWTSAFSSLFARIKSNNPRFIVIGYNSGISPVEEWRSHGFDLEQLAREGHFDLWITQTWGSAWQDYWPQQSSGFTFQLANVLVNLAMLAETRTRHMFLVETFDAWEPWDSIHQYPSKVAWEIWAYSHAAVLKPEGDPCRSAGCYISWMNRRKELLPEQTVTWLVGMLDACSADLSRNPTPSGPCLIYHRAGLEHLLDHPTPYSQGEEMDDWCAMIMKYGLPVLSITRSEWAPMTQADAYIFPAPANLSADVIQWISTRIKEGLPFIFTGLAAQMPELLRRELNVDLEESIVTETLPSCAFLSPKLSVAAGARGLVINQRRRILRSSPHWESLITCLDGPVFAKHKLHPCWIWETPEWGTLRELNLTTQSIQSPQTYVAIVKALHHLSWGAARINWDNLDWLKPVCFLAWGDACGEMTILLGNLETGITGNSQNCAKGNLAWGDPGYKLSAHNMLIPGRIAASDQQAVISLSSHKSCLIHLKKASS